MIFKDQALQSFLRILESEFDYIYFCSRDWSGWSYNTMSVEDFYYLFEDENFIDTLIDIIKGDNITPLYISDTLADYEAYYHTDIDSKNLFTSECFHENWLDFVEIENISKLINNFKIKNKITNF